MAPGQASKRPRAPTTDGELRNSRGKRPRHSLSPSSDDEESSENESQRSEADQSRDNEAEELYKRQTQRVEKQLRNSEAKQNVPNECGIIQEISCTNFMCHEQLKVPLGPLINFIIGHNGSGKSAVLTALTLCLGGKATATNRGQNLKSFIKEGRDHCTIRVKIKNEGLAAYRSDIYGKSITVERHFSRAGTSGFKVKDENDRLISTKKADLEDIIDAFALQIDNPMNVLTQDMARQFLNDSTPKDKYKFFLKGTQLQALRDDYNLMTSELEEMESKCSTLNADVDALKKKFDDALAKAKRAASLEQMKARETLLAHQAAWAHVEAGEKDLEDLGGEVAHFDEIIAERSRTAEYHSAQFETANQAYSDLNQAIQDKQAELAPRQQEHDDINEQWTETKAAIFNVRAQHRDTIGKLQSKDRSIEKYQRQIHEHRQRQAEADGGQHAQKVAELDEAREECDRAREDLTSHDNRLQNLNGELHTARRRKAEQEEKVKEKHEQVARARTTIRELEQGQRNWVDSYPNPANLPKLLRAIEEERRFRETPVGPMGRHVKLLKPEWSSILESSFGASLNAFVVTSKADQTILSELMRKMNCQYPIFIGQNNRIDTSSHEPDPGFDTWLRALTIDNNLVRNQLIVNHAIEQVVLSPDKASANKLMYGDPSARRHVKMCYFINEMDPMKGHVLIVNPHSQSVSLGPVSAYTRKPRMQADKEPQLRAARSNLERLQRESKEAVDEANERKGRVDACQRKVTEHERLRRELKIRAQTAESNVERLELELSAAAPDSGMLEQLEESLKEAQEERKFEEGQLDDILAQKDKLDLLSREQKDSTTAAKGVIEQLNVELDKLARNAEKLKHKREQALREKNSALESVEAAAQTKSRWEEQRRELMSRVQRDTSLAEQICARGEVPRGETLDSLDRKRARLARERVESERELGGSQKQLVEAATIAKRRYHEANEALKRIVKVRQQLNHALHSRNQRWEKFREDISVRARVTFSYLLSDRQFRGELTIDHGKHQLDIQVQPDITVASGAGRQTKTLSGGEKSFSTICLLLSLWDAMGSPIRCLDEFDVFMDSVNRDISMKMMIGAARRAIGRQYILITPQAMNSIQSVDDVKIIKMRDPERGQTALNIGR